MPSRPEGLLQDGPNSRAEEEKGSNYASDGTRKNY